MINRPVPVPKGTFDKENQGGTTMKVIKRDGTTVDFDRSKIVIAIQKANSAFCFGNAI